MDGTVMKLLNIILRKIQISLVQNKLHISMMLEIRIVVTFLVITDGRNHNRNYQDDDSLLLNLGCGYIFVSISWKFIELCNNLSTSLCPLWFSVSNYWRFMWSLSLFLNIFVFLNFYSLIYVSFSIKMIFQMIILSYVKIFWTLQHATK
jgi:hypothetical protein